MPQVLERAQRYDYKRKEEYTTSFKVSKSLVKGFLFHVGTQRNELINDLIKFSEDYQGGLTDNFDLEYHQSHFFKPLEILVNKYVEQGNTSDFLLALHEQVSKGLITFDEIQEQNKRFADSIEEDLKTMNPSLSDLEKNTRNLLSCDL